MGAYSTEKRKKRFFKKRFCKKFIKERLFF